MLMRIGALSEHAGVSAEVLRSWERRYALLEPERTPGGFRLYTEGDVRRVLRVKALIAGGASASQAAHQVMADARDETGTGSASGIPPTSECRAALAAAFRSLSSSSIEAAVDLVFARLDLDSAILEVFIPCLRELGDDWSDGRSTVGEEHVAVNALRGRLMGLSRGWDRGLGPRVVLACPPGDYHDVSLILFGLALHQRGWRVTFLGADTPIETLIEVRETLHPRITVLFSAQWATHAALASGLARLATEPTALAGPDGASLATQAGIRWLQGDPVAEAVSLTEEFRA